VRLLHCIKDVDKVLGSKVCFILADSIGEIITCGFYRETISKAKEKRQKSFKKKNFCQRGGLISWLAGMVEMYLRFWWEG
jgi:hypothetical protein